MLVRYQLHTRLRGCAGSDWERLACSGMFPATSSGKKRTNSGSLGLVSCREGERRGGRREGGEQYHLGNVEDGDGGAAEGGEGEKVTLDSSD